MTEDGWKRVHHELSRLARARAGHDAEEACWLVEGLRYRVHERLGCGTYLEYLERTFGYAPRVAREKLRVAEALAALPGLHAALVGGDLSWSAVRELTRVAVPGTEDAWLAVARGCALRQIEELVSGRRPGDRPDDAPDPAARRHVVRFEVSSETLAALRDARRHVEDEVGHALDDDELVRQLAHHALAGAEPGRAAYQIAMTICESCGRATRDGAGRDHPVAAARTDAARCDAQVLPATHVGHPIPPATQTIRRGSAAPCGVATMAAAAHRAAARPASSRSITSSLAPAAEATTRRISSFCARPITRASTTAACGSAEGRPTISRPRGPRMPAARAPTSRLERPRRASGRASRREPRSTHAPFATSRRRPSRAG